MRVLITILVIWLAPAVLLLGAALWVIARGRPSPREDGDTRTVDRKSRTEAAQPSNEQEAA